MVEGARLESVYRATPYRGFESHPLRHLSLGYPDKREIVCSDLRFDELARVRTEVMPALAADYQLVLLAHELGLMAHPFTLLSDAGFDERQSFEDLLDTLFDDLKIDGAFTDFPEAVLRFLAQREKKH